ncbi:hypothetical protein C8R43DRAFT_962090 [Mycena crocata]|nr:hypothetical protein C8R43DRAFT_962090 [Mycena crocata]
MTSMCRRNWRRQYEFLIGNLETYPSFSRWLNKLYPHPKSKWYGTEKNNASATACRLPVDPLFVSTRQCASRKEEHAESGLDTEALHTNRIFWDRISREMEKEKKSSHLKFKWTSATGILEESMRQGPLSEKDNSKGEKSQLHLREREETKMVKTQPEMLETDQRIVRAGKKKNQSCAVRNNENWPVQRVYASGSFLVLEQRGEGERMPHP